MSVWFPRRAKLLLACLALGAGCAQVDDTGLQQQSQSTTDLAPDTAQGPSDFASLDLAYEPYDASAGDMAKSIITTCDVHSVKVNELQTAGAAGATDEYVELYNPCGLAVTMSGAQVVYRSYNAVADTTIIWSFTTEKMAPKGYFVIANTAFTGTADAKPFPNGGGLAVAGGSVALRSGALPSGVVIDSVGYGTAVNAFVEGHVVAAPGTSQAAARAADGVDTNDNAADFVLMAPTPGAKN